MTNMQQWQRQFKTTLTQFAGLAVTAPELDLNYGLLATAILWPIRRPVQEFDGEIIDTLREITGQPAKHILKAVQNWNDDPLASARSLAAQAQANPELAAALLKLIDYFQAGGPFAEQVAQALVERRGGGDLYKIAGEIKAGLVNIGGTTNIQSLAIQFILGGATPEPIPELPHLPYEPETILIPAGPFVMGLSTEAGGRPYEGPPHQVTLPTYRIGKYPVTNAQYAEFIYKTGRLVGPEAGWIGQHPPADKLNHPLPGVTWFEAMAYCRWLSQQTGRTYTLPTEAQWEKAARGSTGARRYPWGDDWRPDRCHHGRAETAPVDAYPPQSDDGCYDLVGNVREWTRSLWGQRRQSPDPKYYYPWPADGHEDGRNDVNARGDLYRVYRGGAALDDIGQLTCSARGGYIPDKPGPRYKRHGFRVVREL